MKALNRVIFLLVIMFFMQGCSRPGKTVVEPEPDPFNYKFKAEDANLLGLSVTDAAGNSATEIEPGVYQFAENLVPETPIRFVSNNLVEAGTTFQDVDEDGELSGADLMYNVGFELNYIGNFSTPGDRQVFANPLTALIPATGIPSSGIAGLPEQVFEIAISAGVAAAPETPVTLSGDVEEPVNQVISRSVAILTALQESIVITEGQNDVAQSAAVQLLTELTDANLESGLSDLADFSTSVQAAVELTTDPSRTAVVLQVATQVADMVSQTPATEVTFYEAVIVSVQENVSADSTVDSVTTRSMRAALPRGTSRSMRPRARMRRPAPSRPNRSMVCTDARGRPARAIAPCVASTSTAFVRSAAEPPRSTTALPEPSAMHARSTVTLGRAS